MIRRRGRDRTAFVLSGGGNLGALQVGMLLALAEQEIVPDVVLGCSVGALNGAAYSRAPTVAGVHRLARRWSEIDSPTLMPSSFVPNALQLLRKGASLHDSSGLRRTLEAMLGDQLTFESLALEFQCVATNVETAMGHWFDRGDLVPAVMASAALPAVYPPVEIGGVRYLDGGVVDNVPIACGGAGLRQGLRAARGSTRPPGRGHQASPRRSAARLLAGATTASPGTWRRSPRGSRRSCSPGSETRCPLRRLQRTEELIGQSHELTSRFLKARSAEIEAEPGRIRATLRGCGCPRASPATVPPRTPRWTRRA
ncbi:MAG: patatin-like phospholipase family protein [Microthrixaceae bacterium]